MGNLSFEGGRVPWILFGMFRLIQEWTTSRCANATIVNTTPVFSCRHIAIDSLTHSPTGTCKKRDWSSQRFSKLSMASLGAEQYLCRPSAFLWGQQAPATGADGSKLVARPKL